MFLCSQTIKRIHSLTHALVRDFEGEKSFPRSGSPKKETRVVRLSFISGALMSWQRNARTQPRLFAPLLYIGSDSLLIYSIYIYSLLLTCSFFL